MLDHPSDARVERAQSMGTFDPWADEDPIQEAGASTRPPVEGGTYLPDAYGVGDEDERRRLYFYGQSDARIEDERLRIERAWLVGSLHARAVSHLDDQNDADCAAADRAGELHPPMERWSAAAENEMPSYGGRAGPAPPEFHARRGAASSLVKPEPPSTGGKHTTDQPDGSEEPWDAWPLGRDPDTRPVEPEPRAELGLRMSDTGSAAPGKRPLGRSDPPVEADPLPTLRPASRAFYARPADGPASRSAKDFKLRLVMDKADRLGLLGGAQGRDGHREGESELARELRDGMLQRARETYDVGRLATSLDWFEEFQADVRRSPSVLPLRHAGDIEALTYNQETLDMFSEYIRRRGSRMAGRRGETVKSDTVATYVGQIKKLLTHEAHHAITDVSVNVIAPSAHKRMRQLDGPAGERRLSLGLRARHLRQAAENGFDRTSKRGVIEWGAALTAHNLLARGGEVCVCDGEDLDPERDLTLGAIEFKEPSEVSDDLPWLTAEFVPIKDTTVRRRSVVMPVRRRSACGRLGEDPVDTYDAIVLVMRARLGRMPPARGRVEGPEASLPLFVGPKGKPWCTADTRRLARRIASSLGGLDELLFGAKSFRIGGSTDYRAIYGPEGAERLIRQRGRWWSDISALYQRALAAEHLQGSAAVGDARGAELEALCKGWAQPANFR